MPLLAAMILSAYTTPAVYAFEPGHYPEQSVLANGRWMRVSVDADGVYLLSNSTLRSWGFSDPTRVRVYGTGGRRMPDLLSPDNYPGDLPLLQSEVTQQGVVFYAQGPGAWEETVNARFVYRANVYTAKAYYFVTESDEPAREIPVVDSSSEATEPADWYYHFQHYENEVFSPGEAGPLLLGEDFRYTRSRNFDFPVEGTPVTGSGSGWFECSFVSNFQKSAPRLSFEVGGKEVASNSSDQISPAGSSKYTHGIETVTRHNFDMEGITGGKLRLTVALGAGGSTDIAALNYISIGYKCRLALPAREPLVFHSPQRALSMEVADPQSLTIWNVSNPRNIARIGFSTSPGKAVWNMGTAVNRRFAAWSSTSHLPSPKAEGFIATQNLHGLESPDMVIVTPEAFKAQAQRLAELHANSSDSLVVAVAILEHVYNEFSGGHADPGGLRNFFKMLYDRGTAGTGRPLRYALLMGRMTFDNRHLLESTGSHPTIPGWTPWSVRASLSDNEGYFSDDIAAMLSDGSGTTLGRDKLDIAIGRIPVTSADEARDVVDKAIEYAAGNRRSPWKQRALFLADDGDNNIHLNQTETMIAGFDSSPDNSLVVRKVYLGAFTREGGVFPSARARMFRSLDEGVVWWNFIGHASTTGWTGDGQLSYTDINNLYLRHVPFVYASTCDFLRLDGSVVSGAEILYKQRYGGCIGVISATRPVYIADNGPLSAAVGRAMAMRDSNGRLLAPGEIYRRGKNDIRDSKGNPVSDENRLRYVFVGDPALRLALPSNTVRIDSINGKAVDPENPVEIAALSTARISGSIIAPDQTPMSGFNGVVVLDILDAEHSTTTVVAESNPETVFQELGERVFTGATKVECGKFTISASIPVELSQNYRPATMCTFAYAENSNDEAAGIFRDFYLYGYDENTSADEEAPVIESMVMNHSDFRNGDTVNDSPMLIARVTDNRGINVSTAGIGHQITATLDSTKTFTDLAYYYTPLDDGTPGGIINYPFEGLTPGQHTMRLRVWDTSGNSETAELDFVVAPGLQPRIYDCYSDCNPASTSANFYLRHDQPDAMVDVEVTVFNLIGRPVWTGRASGRSDMFLTVPVSWDLTDGAGRRVGRGIYLYRASITTDGQTYQTASRRIAVTAQ